MSTLTTERPAARPATGLAPADDHRVTLARVVRSEWTKLRSLRSNWITVGVALTLTIGITLLLMLFLVEDLPAGEQIDPMEAVFLGLAAMVFTIFTLSVLGALQMSGEYGTGMIRASLTAVPRRLPVLLAKTIVLVAAMVPVALIAAFGSYAVTVTVLGDHTDLSLADPGVARMIFGAAGAAVLFGVIGLAVAAITRNTAAAITVLAGVLFVAPPLLPLLPAALQRNLVPYLPESAGRAMYAVAAEPPQLSPGAGTIVLLATTLVLLGIGGAFLARRDA